MVGACGHGEVAALREVEVVGRVAHAQRPEHLLLHGPVVRRAEFQRGVSDVATD